MTSRKNDPNNHPIQYQSWFHSRRHFSALQQKQDRVFYVVHKTKVSGHTCCEALKRLCSSFTKEMFLNNSLLIIPSFATKALKYRAALLKHQFVISHIYEYLVSKSDLYKILMQQTFIPFSYLITCTFSVIQDQCSWYAEN